MVVTDVGSTKRTVVRKAEQVLPPNVFFIGGHPMAGSEKSGVAAADPFLFQNAIYVICPASRVPEALCREFGDFLQQTGARVMIMDAEEHDRNVSIISHLPQLLAVSLVCYASTKKDDANTLFELAAGGFRDMTRIASSSFGMWHDIIESNKQQIEATLQEFGQFILDLSGRLEPESLKELFDRAALFRSGIPRDTKGFMKPLAELLVLVEDKPGMILGVSKPLADAGITIKDIEVLKVREGEGGTFRLAFGDKETSEKARKILAGCGFEVRHR
jgi:prephenate dehydrogenase